MRQEHSLWLLLCFASLPFTASPGSLAAEDAPPRVDFIRDVSPALSKAGCNAGKCHGSFQGRGGFQLSLLGFDPLFDHEALVRHARGRRLNPAAPALSLVLRKPVGAVPHGGGVRFSSSDPAYRVLFDWISQGAPAPADPELRVTQLDITPSEIVRPVDEDVQLQVVAVWSDGRKQDVTKLALYETRDESYAEINEHGLIRLQQSGRTSAMVTFMGVVRAITVTAPYDQPETPLAFSPNNYIDELVAAEWQKVGLRPVELANDYELARRLYLDIIGTLPTAEELQSFANDKDPNKQSQLIETLLARDEYVDRWSSHWADLLRVHRRYVGDKGMWSFWNWVQTSVRENRPLDQMARELIASRGNLYTNGATAYYYVDDDPMKLAETTSQLFLGVRLQCARCHHHPYETWSQEDYFGLASFFTRIELKDNGDGGRYGGVKLLRPIDKPNRTRRVTMATEPSLLGRGLPEESNADIRVHLAEWITAKENPYFARNFANRYWSYLMGRGLVEPVDDLRASNPATHPQLLDALAQDLIDHDFDARHLIRVICNSRTYQLASRAAPEVDREGVFYTHRQYQRLPAAVLLDAVNQACQTSESFKGLPAGTRAISLPDPAIPSYFLDAFGRSVRASPCECAVSRSPDLAQTLHLINSDELQQKVTHAKGRVAQLLEQKTPDAEFVADLYLATLNRPPQATETTVATRLLAESPSRKEAAEDILWVLLNSTEFVFNH